MLGAQNSEQHNCIDNNSSVGTAFSGDNNNTSSIRDIAMISSPGTSQDNINVTPAMSGCQPLMSVEDSAANHQPAMQLLVGWFWV